MARKSRVPPPPRPVQAPRTRVDERPRNWRALLVIALTAGAVFAVVAATLAFGLVGGRSSGPEAALREAGCAAKKLQPGS